MSTLQDPNYYAGILCGIIIAYAWRRMTRAKQHRFWSVITDSSGRVVFRGDADIASAIMCELVGLTGKRYTCNTHITQ